MNWKEIEMITKNLLKMLNDWKKGPIYVEVVNFNMERNGFSFSTLFEQKLSISIKNGPILLRKTRSHFWGPLYFILKKVWISV
jgi:hypothetical protein